MKLFRCVVSSLFLPLSHLGLHFFSWGLCFQTLVIYVLLSLTENIILF